MRLHVFLLAIAVIGLAAPAAHAQTAEEVRRAYEEAVANPLDEAKVAAFIAVLPRVEDYYVVEGDIPMTRREVEIYLTGKAIAGKKLGSGPELITNVVNGELDYWQYPSQRTLRYWVHAASFRNDAEVETVVADMAAAARSWEDACPDCGLSFVRVEDRADALFTVKSARLGGSTIAMAFFPSYDASRRFVWVDSNNYFGFSSRVGVLRHELGHVLGYRHEHIRGIPACARQSARDTEPYAVLTPYDPQSVMHYRCGANTTLRLDLTETDIAGHRRLYGPLE